MNSATIDAHGYVFSMHLLNAGVVFTYRRGVMVARFDKVGNPRASKRGASKGQSPRFFVYNHEQTMLN